MTRGRATPQDVLIETARGIAFVLLGVLVVSAVRVRAWDQEITPTATFQTTVVVSCVFIMFRRDKASRAASRAWRRHPFTIRDLAQERGPETEDGFVWTLGNAGIEAAVARALLREIQSIVSLHYGVKNFPVRPDDELRSTYLFTLGDWTGYPDDPDLFASALMIIKPTKRRLPKEPELQLAQLRTVMDLARWVQELPSAEGADAPAP